MSSVNNPTINVNDLLIIERFDRPWRLTNVVSIDDDVITVTGGFRYAVATGERLDAHQSYTKGERVTPLSVDGVAYLTILAFQQELPRFELRAVPRVHRVALARLVRSFCETAGVDLGALSRIPLDGSPFASPAPSKERRARRRSTDGT